MAYHKAVKYIHSLTGAIKTGKRYDPRWAMSRLGFMAEKIIRIVNVRK